MKLLRSLALSLCFKSANTDHMPLRPSQNPANAVPGLHGSAEYPARKNPARVAASPADDKAPVYDPQPEMNFRLSLFSAVMDKIPGVPEEYHAELYARVAEALKEYALNRGVVSPETEAAMIQLGEQLGVTNEDIVLASIIDHKPPRLSPSLHMPAPSCLRH